MRNIVFVVILGLICLLYGGINYYIGIRGWQTIGSRITWLNGKVYWTMFWLLALSYLIARLGRAFLPSVAGRNLTLIGSFWLGAMFYFFLIIVLVDVVRLLNRWLGFLPENWTANPSFATGVGLAVLMLVIGVIGYGYWNARHPQIRHYDLDIAKHAGKLNELHVVMVSDIHLGTIIHNGQLVKMTDMIRRLNPDIVLFAGDVIEENIEVFVEQQMEKSFHTLKPKYGMFAVLGNHEYIGGHAGEIVTYLQKSGVEVLLDRYVKVADGFYVMGRDDKSGHRAAAKPRLGLVELMRGMDKSYPIIMLDHQPVQLEEAEAQGVDLQLSGHTHRGQLFPNQLITSKIFEIDWGYLRKGNFQVIVSSGYGTWGPPIRVGNTPEIVDINIRFLPK